MELMRWVGSVMWPFVRIGAMLMAAPVLGARSVPVRVRLVLGLAIAVVVAPLLPAVPAVDPLSPAGLMIGVRQVLLGVAMGFIWHMVFAVLVLAGQTIAMTMGLGFASAVDPQNGVQVPVLSQYFLITATLVFLALDGHLMLIDVLVQSFRLMPVGGTESLLEMPWKIVLWGSHMFASALLIALPATIAILMVNLAFGVMTRAAPQLNIFAVGFPVTLLAGFVLLLFSLPGLLPRISALLGEATELMLVVLQ